MELNEAVWLVCKPRHDLVESTTLCLGNEEEEECQTWPVSHSMAYEEVQVVGN